MTTKGLPFVSLLTEICGYILFVSVLAVMYGTVEEAERHCHVNTPLSQSVKLSPILQQVMRFWSTKKVPVQTIPLFGLMGICTSAPLPTTHTI